MGYSAYNNVNAEHIYKWKSRLNRNFEQNQIIGSFNQEPVFLISTASTTITPFIESSGSVDDGVC